MKIKMTVISVVAILAVTGVILYSNNIIMKPSASNMQAASVPSAASVATSTAPIAGASIAPERPGIYVDYSSGIISKTTGTKILFFHAPWCPQCQMLEKDIKATTLPDNVTIIKVDYDSQNDLRVKYGVTLQTTLVKISNDGEQIKKFVAYSDPTFQNVKQNLLD